MRNPTISASMGFTSRTGRADLRHKNINNSIVDRDGLCWQPKRKHDCQSVRPYQQGKHRLVQLAVKWPQP